MTATRTTDAAGGDERGAWRESMGLPHYAIERDPMTAAAAHSHPRACPACGKAGAWSGWRFIPANERAAPRCYCRTMADAGPDVYGYDPEAKQFLRRAASAQGAAHE